MFDRYFVEVIVYDEVEKFRQPPNNYKESSVRAQMLYDYPYMDRTTMLS